MSTTKKNLIGYHLPMAEPYYGEKFSESDLLYSKLKTAFDKTNTRSFQIFLKSPKSPNAKVKLTKEDKAKCKEFVTNNKIHLVNHSSYFINFARTYKENVGKVKAIVDDLINIDAIGGFGTVFHVGKCVEKLTCADGTKNMKHNMEQVIDKIIELKLDANLILETGAGQGTEMFTKMEELGAFYHSFSEKYKEKLRICIDTCHIFSAGYDLRTVEKAKKYIKLVSKTIGWENVACIHLNDSAVELGKRVDRHQNFKKGYITFGGMEGIQEFVKYCAKKKIPMMLETPIPEDASQLWKGRQDEVELIRQLL